MAKKTEKVKPKDTFKVEFKVKFNGELNYRRFNQNEGDIVEVSKGELEWLSAKKVIRV